MTKFKIEKFQKVKKGWKETIVDRIDEGKVLPFISNLICNNLAFGSHTELVEGWAETFGYPLADRQNLPQMTQFHSVMSKADPEIKADDRYIKDQYLDFLKEALYSMANPALVEELREDADLPKLSFSDIAVRLRHPAFDDGLANPLLLLADLPLPIYLTTSYHNFIEIALQKAGRIPRTEICYWNEHLRSIPSIFEIESRYQPTPREPLVYHLHGLDAHPASLVLTEDDYLDFLVTISEKKEDIPLRVRQALADSSLILLGYSLRDWDFRVLLRGMVKPSDNERRPKSVCLQLQVNEQEKNYLENYLIHEAKFEVYWGDTLAFLQELWHDWKNKT